MPDRILQGCRGLGAIILFIAGYAIASAETLPVKQYTTADGLGYDRVNRIIRDSRGFLWFCTSEGLSRFDGYEFKNYSRADGLPHSSINDLLELDDGTYLVATGDGVAWFDPKGVAGKNANGPPMFRAYRTRTQMSEQKPVSIAELHMARDGKVWAGAWDGLHLLSREGDGWRVEPIEAEAWRGKSPEFYRIIEDRFGRLWLGAFGGVLFVFDSRSGESFAVQDKSVGLSVLEDDRGRVWSGGGFPGLYLFDVPEPGRRPTLLKHFTTADGLSDNHWINALMQTSDGRILVGVNNALCEFLPDAKPGEPSFRPLLKIDVVSLAEDSAGNIWIGTAASGAAKLTRRGVNLFQFKSAPGVVQGFTSIFAGEGKELFLTWGQYDLFRHDGEKVSEIRPRGLPGRSWGYTYLDLRSRVDGDWWIPTNEGLARYTAVRRFEQLARTPPVRIYTERDGLGANVVFRLYEDSRGDLWMSSLPLGKPLTLWDRRTDTFQQFTDADGLPPAECATAFGEDAAGNLWLGFYNGGVARFRDGRFEYFNHKFLTGLTNRIHKDALGRLWIAISNSGVVRVDNPDAETPNFVNIGAADGLASDRANCITEDNAGRIYVGTGRGISRIEPETRRIKNYTQADGLPYNNITVCTRDAEGNLWFTQRFVAVRLTPDPAAINDPPPVFIASLRVNGETVRKLSELGETSVAQLELKPDQRQIQIGFFGLSFSTGERLLYQYKLDGVGSDWSEPSALRTVNLTLAPGSYRFLVRALNAEGAVSQNPAIVSLTILRPIWQRWWFLTLTALLMIGIAYALYRYRLAQLLKVERVRTRIATDLHDDIGASLSRMAILSEVVKQQTVSDNGKQAAPLLTEIADSARGLVDSMGDIVWSIDPRRDDLKSVVRRIRQFASDVLEAKGIDWQLQVPPEVENLKLSPEQRQHLFLIFKEGINNIARHGEGAKSVSLSIGIEGRQLVGEIKDDGCGFLPKEPDEERSKGRGGNGLPNMRERASQVGGRLEIVSAPGTGTKVTFRSPMK